MPLTSVDKFVVRVFKSLTGSPLNVWANSYEFTSTDPVSTGELSVLASALVLFEQQFHHDVVQFHRAVVSTWTADSVPYDPTAFLTIPLAGVGSIGPTGDLLALNTCLKVARTPATGRLGHLFYRGVLGEDEVAAPAGITVLVDPSGKNEQIQDAIETAELGAYLGDPSSATLNMAMINVTGDQVRNVLSLTAQGVSTIPTDHAWFNRTPAGPPS